MRVLQVTDYGGPHGGSFVPMLRAAIAECDSRGIRVEAVFPERARGRGWLSRLDGMPVRFIEDRSRRAAVSWLRRALAEEPGPAILHTHFSRFDMPAVAAAAGRRDVRVIWHVHTVLGEGAAVRAANRFKLALVARRVDRILCVAPHLAEGIRARGAPAGRVSFFPNGLDVDAFAPADSTRRAKARDSLGIARDATVALHFGRVWDLKGGDLFLRAVAQLRATSVPGLVAITARGGDPARELANELGIADAVLVPGAVEDVSELYAAADLLMATSRGEGMPLTVLEAAASGLGVVASDIPGHRIPGAELPGVVIAPLDPIPLAAAAERLLARHPQDAARDAAVGREWLRREMGLDAWARRLADLYEATGAPGSSS